MSLSLAMTRRPDGQAYLHTWRQGSLYYHHNREVMLRSWTNLRHRFHCHHRDADEILVHDSRRGVPAPDGAFHGAYSCHVVEHLDPRQALAYVRELHRVLKPGSICRLSVPDLELCAREYLASLAAAVEHGDEDADQRYELAARSLVDPFARRACGGELLRYFRGNKRNLAYAVRVHGAVCDEFLRPDERKILPALMAAAPVLRPRRTVGEVWDDLKVRVIGRLSRSRSRAIGENESWGWDRYSLRKVCIEAGFVECSDETAASSRLPVWSEHGFDTLAGSGAEIETSVYLEARKST